MTPPHPHPLPPLPDADRSQHRWLPLNLVAQMALGLLAMTICLPSMQDWAGEFATSQARVQLTFSGFVAAFGGLQLVHGPLSDRIGRKPVLMGGLVLCLLGSLLSAAATNLTWLTLARILQGAGSAAGMVVGRAMVQDFFQGAGRTRMMAFIGMTMGVCPPVAMVLGGHLHVRLGWQAGFLVVAGLTCLLMVAAWRGLPANGLARPPPPRTRGLGTLFAGYATLTGQRTFLLYVAILSSASGTFYAFLAGAPLVLGHYGVTPDQVGLYIMAVPISYMVGNGLTSRLAGRCSERLIMNLGQSLSCAGPALVLILAFAGIHTPLALALPLVLLGIGNGLLMPPTLVGTVGLVPALAGSASALAGLMQQMTGALAGFLIGLVLHETPVNLALMMFGWIAIGVLAQAVMHGTARRPWGR